MPRGQEYNVTNGQRGVGLGEKKNCQKYIVGGACASRTLSWLY